MSKTQLEHLEDLVKLKKDNPELMVHFCVDNDDLCDEDRFSFQYMLHCEVLSYYDNDGIFITDIDDVISQLEYDYGRDVSEEEALKETEKAIFVKLSG